MHHSMRHQQFELELRDIPEAFQDGFRSFFLRGDRPSGLVAAIVSGSLFDTYTRADVETRELIPSILRFVINTMPWGAYGSPEHVAMWCAKGGLLGRPVRKVA